MHVQIVEGEFFVINQNMNMYISLTTSDSDCVCNHMQRMIYRSSSHIHGEHKKSRRIRKGSDFA